LIYSLYVKQNNTTNLKYLGQTQRDPYKYKGSGKYWVQHLKKHGNEVTTYIIGMYDTKEELKAAGIYYSDLWNVIEARDPFTGKKYWANLKEEAGDGGKPSEETRAKLSESHIGHVPWNKGKKMSEAFCKTISLAHIGKPNGRLGFKFSEGSKLKCSLSQLGNQNAKGHKQVPWNKGTAKQHGTPYFYKAYKCRCVDCKTAYVAYHRSWRAKKKSSKILKEVA
jgi:hypothetical protein